MHLSVIDLLLYKINEVDFLCCLIGFRFIIFNVTCIQSNPYTGDQDGRVWGGGAHLSLHKHNYECNNSHGKLTRNLQKDSYITKAARKIYTELGRMGRNTSGWIYK